MIKSKKPSPKLVSLLKQFFLNVESALSSHVAALVPVGQCQKNDFVLLKNSVPPLHEAALVHFHVSIDGQVYTFIDLFVQLSFDSISGVGKYQPCHEQFMVLTSTIMCPCLHSSNNDGSIRALIPLACRC